MFLSYTVIIIISLPYITAARTAGIDRNEEIRPLSPYVHL